LVDIDFDLDVACLIPLGVACRRCLAVLDGSHRFGFVSDSGAYPMPLLTQLKIDRSGATTIADQIARHFEAAARGGRIPFGTRLPSIRDLSEQLGVSRNSAVHAYEMLTDRGVIAPRLGSGYFVQIRSCPAPQHAPLRGNSRDSLVKLRANTDFEDFVISSALLVEGFSSDLAASEDLRAAIRHTGPRVESMLLDEDQDSCWRGSHSLLAVIAQELSQRGIPLEVEGSQILVDSLQDALGLVFDALGVVAGDCVMVEDPASLALRSVVIARGLVPQLIKRSADHLEIYPDGAAAAVGVQAADGLPTAGVKAIVVTSNFHDPTGGMMSPHERTQLLTLAAELDVPLIEIDPYPGLFFGEVFQTPISALDGLDRTIYISDVGSLFSNTFHHHVICARSEFVRGLVRRRALAHGRTTVWEQAVLQDLWTRGCHRKQVIRLQRLLRERRDLVHGMLTRMAPADIRWSIPLGGIHMWLEFPAGRKNIQSVFDAAVRDGVVLARGEFFGFSGGHENCVRLNFSRFDPVQTYADLKCLFGKWSAAPDLAKNLTKELAF